MSVSILYAQIPTGNLVPLDLEIEATVRRNRAERRMKLLQDRTIASILELMEEGQEVLKVRTIT